MSHVLNSFTKSDLLQNQVTQPVTCLADTPPSYTIALGHIFFIIRYLHCDFSTWSTR